jgi:dTDP-4-amino-4,6-dideoxygalactose transaminase
VTVAVDKFIVFNQPDLGEEEMSAVMDVIRSGWIGTGKVSHQFEEEFAEFMGGGYAVAVSSCTIGLELALKSVGMGNNSKVVTTPLTFAATINAILHSGARPVFVDVDKNGCMDMDQANEKTDFMTKAILPVHFSGTPCDLSKLNGEVKIIEDCAHAFGSLFGRPGDIKVFSFYANKNITCGEGGMVLTKDKALADEIRIFSSQGLSKGAWARFGDGPVKQYQVEKVGLKGNLPDILAAIGLVQLRRWPELRQKRLKVWRVYEKAFGKIHPGHSTHFYPYRTKYRDQVRQILHNKGIGAGVHYKPLHLEPAYQFLGYKKGDFPMAEKWGDTELSLPISATMTEEDALRVVEEIQKVTRGRNGI